MTNRNGLVNFGLIKSIKLFTRSNISISSLCLSKDWALSEQIKRPFFLSNSFCDEKPVGIDMGCSDGFTLNFSQDRFEI